MQMSEEKWILIVDDVEANRFVLRNIIVDMGYKPMLAENGLQALKILERKLPDLILLDVSMPEMDGYEFCSRIKDKPDTRDIPVIFISAFDEMEDIIKGFKIGGSDYITKPFIKEVVEARVNNLLILLNAKNELKSMNHQLIASVNDQLSQLEDEKKNVLFALASVARENASHEENYLDRLQYNCRILAQAMQLSPLYETQISDAFIDSIEIASPLCDLGNISISSSILQKKGTLDQDELETMKTHTLTGAKILRDIARRGNNNDYLNMAIDICECHHENWDGSGYPNGIAGDDIPLAAQIVSIINVYCALTDERSYRAAFSSEEAIHILEKSSGSKYNSGIFNICKVIYRQFH